MKETRQATPQCMSIVMAHAVMGVDNRNTEPTERAVLLIIDDLGGRLPPEQLQYMRDLANAGEPGIALEDLCTQIFEYDVVIGTDLLAKIQDVGQAMKIDPKYWGRFDPGRHV